MRMGNESGLCAAASRAGGMKSARFVLKPLAGVSGRTEL